MSAISDIYANSMGGKDSLIMNNIQRKQSLQTITSFILKDFSIDDERFYLQVKFVGRNYSASLMMTFVLGGWFVVKLEWVFNFTNPRIMRIIKLVHCQWLLLLTKSKSNLGKNTKVTQLSSHIDGRLKKLHLNINFLKNESNW